MATNSLLQRPRTRIGIALIICVISLAAMPLQASAQGSGSATAASVDTPTTDQYVDVHTRIQTSTASPPPASGGLPFTGFDVGIVAIVGAGLLGLGFALRRVSTPDA